MVRFEHISKEDGLSQSGITCILQDSLGYLWFGTGDGLNKYNGYGFEIYSHDPEDPKSLSNNSITSIYEDHEGVLWIGTLGGGLDRLDPETERFAQFGADPDDPHSLGNPFVYSILEDREGMFWIATDEGVYGGLHRFDRKTERSC